MKKFLYLIIAITMISVAACSAAALPKANKPQAPQPPAGAATVTGRVVSSTDGHPLDDLIVRLGEVMRDTNSNNSNKGAYIMDDSLSPGARTDSQGYFVMENVPPKEYVVLVGYSSGRYKVIDNGTKVPLTWVIQAGKIFDIGEIKSDIIR